MRDPDEEQYTRRPSWLFIIAVLLALLFACLGVLLISGWLPGLASGAPVGVAQAVAAEPPIAPDEIRARAGFLLWPTSLPPDAAADRGAGEPAQTGVMSVGNPTWSDTVPPPASFEVGRFSAAPPSASNAVI